MKVIKPKNVKDIAAILSNTLETLQTEKPQLARASVIVDASRAYILALVTAKRYGNIKH